MPVISEVGKWNILCFIRHTFGLPDGFLCISPNFLRTPVFPCDTALLKQSCSCSRPGPVRGNPLVKCTSGPSVPSSLSPNTYASAFRPGSNGDCCTHIVGFFMSAILFNIAPEELCSVFQSSKYKSCLNLSPKCSYCCQERILEECGPDFHSLIWSP